MSVIFSQDLNFRYVPQNISYIMKHPNSTSKHILNNGIFEQDLINWCIQNYKNPNKIFIDIGAHIGTYAINIANHFKHTYAFEAQRETFYYLAGNVALNSLTSKIIAYNYALTSHDDKGKLLELKIISDDGGGSSIKNLSNNISPITTEKVSTKALDDYNLNDVGFIKIDVEGAEIDVLKGAINTLKNNNYPPFIFEVWPDEWFKNQRDELFEYIKQIGYNTQLIYSNNMYLATK